jgi:hypothetical protein
VSPVPGPTIYGSATAAEAARLLGSSGASALQVVERSGDPIGTLTAGGLLAFYARQKEKEESYHSPLATRRLMVGGRRGLARILGDRWK